MEVKLSNKEMTYMKDDSISWAEIDLKEVYEGGVLTVNERNLGDAKNAVKSLNSAAALAKDNWDKESFDNLTELRAEVITTTLETLGEED